MMGSRPLRMLMALAPGIVACGLASPANAQLPPYDVRPPVEPPYHRVRYEASTQPGGLIFPATYTAWIPPGVTQLRGVIVHQHGCGEGSCSSGLSGAHDLHWQALARAHHCALVAPAYEQPEGADCQMWCDPRNGSATAFERALADLGTASGHPELATVPWALWGHSGGGHWAGGMSLLRPERVVAAWLRSGVPLLEPDPQRAGIKPHTLVDAALRVPIMCNPGTKEGVTVTEGRFKGVWPANRAFFTAIRARGGLVGVAIDPLTSHECGNQRYLAIPWLDACLAARLRPQPGEPLAAMPIEGAWLGPVTGGAAVAAAGFTGDPLTLGWLPNERIAKAWTQYVTDTAVADPTPPPAPRNVRIAANELAWDADADLESGLAGFAIERDGRRVASLPEKQRNPFGRPLFQGLLYSDTPPQPLAAMRYTDAEATPGTAHDYRVIALNTAGLESPPAGAVRSTDAASSTEWGRIDRAAERLGRLRLVVTAWPPDGKLRLPPRLPQVVRAVIRAPGSREVPVEISKDGADVDLILPGDSRTQDGTSVTIDVDVADTTAQFDDGRIVLTARDARVDGGRARLETQPGNHRIGFWSDAADTVSWTWRATRWGRYDARLCYSSAGPEGTVIEVTIGGTTVSGTLASTGNWYRYATLPLGPVGVTQAGDVNVRVRCTKLAGSAVMNLKSLTLEPACEGEPPVQADDGVVTLHGRDATVLGTVLRYEPAEAKQTLGFWTRVSDAAAWTFTIRRAGTFDVEVLQGCGAGSGGSEMGVAIDETAAGGGRRLGFTVEDTGGFQRFKPRVVGRVELDVGEHALRIRPERIAKGAACDIRQVRLVPASP